MWTPKLPPAARSVGPELSTCGLLPEIEQRPGFDCVSIDQVTPAPEPAGRLSLTVTFLARPVPLLLTVIVKPIGSPAFTVPASAVFRMWIEAGRQWITSPDVSEPSLVVVTLAVLL